MLNSAPIKTKTIVKLANNYADVHYLNIRFQIFRLSFYVYNFEQFNKLSDFSQISVKLLI